MKGGNVKGCLLTNVFLLATRRRRKITLLTRSLLEGTHANKKDAIRFFLAEIERTKSGKEIQRIARAWRFLSLRPAKDPAITIGRRHMRKKKQAVKQQRKKKHDHNIMVVISFHFSGRRRTEE